MTPEVRRALQDAKQYVAEHIFPPDGGDAAGLYARIEKLLSAESESETDRFVRLLINHLDAVKNDPPAILRAIQRAAIDTVSWREEQP